MGIIENSLHQAETALHEFISDPQTPVLMEKAVAIFKQALDKGCKIISCGNGGSLCDAAHFAEELTGRFRGDRRPLPAMAINDAALHMRGYRTLQAETAHKCRELLCFHAVDLIVLDILLPDGDGVALCREIKQEYDVPILFLTAMGENEDIVKGLTAGGDDYLTKPYDLEVFMARVEARLRAAHPKERAVRFGPLQMNLLSGRAYIGETDLNLTQKEFAALLYLALLRRQGTVPPRSLAGELRWDRGRIEAAETALRELGLVAPAETPPAPAEEKR